MLLTTQHRPIEAFPRAEMSVPRAYSVPRAHTVARNATATSHSPSKWLEMVFSGKIQDGHQIM